MSSILIFAAIAFTALATSFISGILGMAGGLILMAVLLALLPLPAAMMVHCITQLASNGWRAWLWRAHIDMRVFRGYAAGSFAALLLFALIQFVVSKPVAYILLGLTPFVSYVLPDRLQLNIDRHGQPTLCGFICTAVQLMAGVSGPLLDVFFVRSRLDRKGVVATKAMTQSFGHLVKIVYFGGVAVILSAASKGEIEKSLSIFLAATCVALAFAGTTLSRRVLEKMTDANFRRWTQWTVMTLGVVNLAAGLWLLSKQL
ncbi:MAG: TSUP family transporter [Betaproteobacteria bacterium]|nr:TSUP family transporter [Betaproteobacteria bacterium]